MFAQLSLELLLQGVELSLVPIEIVIVRLLGQVSQNLAWRIVEVSWSALGVNSLALISLLLLVWGILGVLGGLSALWRGTVLVSDWWLLLRGGVLFGVSDDWGLGSWLHNLYWLI